MKPSCRLCTFVLSCFCLSSFPSAAQPLGSEPPSSNSGMTQRNTQLLEEADPDESIFLKEESQLERLIRLQGQPGLEVELVLNSGRRTVILPESVALPLTEASITIEAFGFFPEKMLLEPLEGGIQTVDVDLRPVPRVRSLSTWGWAAIGLGLVSALGAVAVEDSVNFHSAPQKAWIQWSLIGGGGGLFLTGIGLQNWARQLQRTANTARRITP